MRFKNPFVWKPMVCILACLLSLCRMNVFAGEELMPVSRGPASLTVPGDLPGGVMFEESRDGELMAGAGVIFFLALTAVLVLTILTMVMNTTDSGGVPDLDADLLARDLGDRASLAIVPRLVDVERFDGAKQDEMDLVSADVGLRFEF